MPIPILKIYRGFPYQIFDFLDIREFLTNFDNSDFEIYRGFPYQFLDFLDIGGGIGAIQYGLIKAGASNGVSIEASSAYLDVVKNEIIKSGLAEKVNFKHGDFTTIASDIDLSDIVTLDKVICCYDYMYELVRLSSKIARKIYALIYPREEWWTKSALPIMNLYPKIKGSSFRVFIHPTKMVEEIIFGNGLKRYYYAKTLFWQVAIFTR